MAVANKHPSKVAMSRARHPETGRILLASEIAEQVSSWPKPLSCYTIGCHARVHAVTEVPRTEKKGGRAAYFARNRACDGGTNDHTVHCVYNLSQIITVLTRDSGGLLQRGRSTSDPETGEPTPVYRLPWPEAFTRPPRGSTSEATSPEGAVFSEEATKLLNTAAKIAELLDRYQQMREHPEVMFRAVCKGQDVEWLYFLYTPQRAWLLARNLRRAELTHPVAVIFRPGGHDIIERGDRAWVRAEIATPEDHDDTAERLFVGGATELMKRIFRSSERAISARMYIGYGMWTSVSHSNLPPRPTLELVDGSLVAELPPSIDREVLRRWSAFRAVRD
ncbi:hypothetical protein AB0H71_31715 [Nocardia sp. NPDC050697]|uniref:hypothetical protein n=1 Tax=Nocardia sp. NPDC050697 TaxID=3155158 RepID=UPI0033F8E8C3